MNTDRLCELYISAYSDVFFLKDGNICSVLFHVIKSHLIKRINIYKEELLIVSLAPERVYVYYSDEIYIHNTWLKTLA